MTASYHLGALNAGDTQRYIEHRLHHVGWANDPSFTEDAFAHIFKQTNGIPRRINTLCSRLLLLGFLEEQHEITEKMVSDVAAELTKELGGAPAGSGAALRSSATLRSDGNPLRAQNGDGDHDPRLSRLEDKVERHDRAINRAFDIALRYLPHLGDS